MIRPNTNLRDRALSVWQSAITDQQKTAAAEYVVLACVRDMEKYANKDSTGVFYRIWSNLFFEASDHVYSIVLDSDPRYAGKIVFPEKSS